MGGAEKTSRVVGIDLAGSEKNDTGFCLLVGGGAEKKVNTALLKGDADILLQCRLANPDLVAIDAPLTRANNGYMRLADEELKQYGALPQNLRGMACLVDRGVKLGAELRKEFKVIEVCNNATAKILGIYDKGDSAMQKRLAAMLEGDLKSRMLKRDELDAICAALAGFLHAQGKAAEVGDEEGKIAVPKV